MKALITRRLIGLSGATRHIPVLALLFFGLGGLVDAVVNLLFFGRAPLLSWNEIALYLLTGLTLGAAAKQVWPAR
ncbi:MAG: hypothetical protein CML17_13340, partial [Pusillimonas sp.]|nr:hypothetical protein [Pusillimonas sp.]